VRSLWLRFFLLSISTVRYKILRLEVEKTSFHSDHWPTCQEGHVSTCFRPNIHQNGPEILGIKALEHGCLISASRVDSCLIHVLLSSSFEVKVLEK
jgi:hypothetical protein